MPVYATNGLNGVGHAAYAWAKIASEPELVQARA